MEISKQTIVEGRERIRRLHVSGAGGLDVARAYSQFVDSVVIEVYLKWNSELVGERGNG
ncbi:MAG: hypothetical protein HY731_00475, partial [Candidatus Tectomicrobia bacterium]|nr:hypothetical protein [Candidatus Tectomicrobia bacterium]